jgi:chromosome segregation ATPase
MLSALVLTVASATLLSFEASSMDLKERPVAKVVKLLKDMKSELETEHKKDTELFEKMGCWCETNEKAKTTAIETANSRIDQLHSDIGKYSGKTGQLEATIAQSEKELGENSAGLDKATEVRAKESAEFNQEEKDIVQSLAAMKNAITVLGKHHSEFLQKGAAHHAVKQVLKHKLPAEHKQVLTSFVQTSQPGLTNSGSYAPASGQIFGILKQMKEEFESNLAKMQEEEKTAQTDFAELKTAKSAEIAGNKKMTKDKTAELADTEDALAKAKEDLDLTREALAADTKFLSELKLRCQQSDKDFELRSKTRLQEIAGVSETIKILTDDDAREVMGKTMDSETPVFTQTQAETTMQAKMRAKASAALKMVAKKQHSLALLALSQRVKLDPFKKLNGIIDDMSGALKKQLQDEVVERDFCVKEFNENDVSTLHKNNEIKDLQALIETSKATIDTLTSEMAQLQKDIEEMEVQMKKASEEREAANHEFQVAVTDQRATQTILKKALARLEQFYGKQTLIQMGQEPGAAVPPPPPAMSEMKPNQGSGGVMMLIQNIIEEAHEMEVDALSAEADAQAGYEEFIKNSNAAIATAKKQITEKTDSRADTEATKVGAEGDMAAALTDAEKLATYKAELHKSCDFLTKNFDMRQGAITAEIEGLGQAKSILAGADFGF